MKVIYNNLHTTELTVNHWCASALCPVGWYSVSGLPPCTQCSHNTFWANSTSCSPCPSGEKTLATGSHNITQCIGERIAIWLQISDVFATIFGLSFLRLCLFLLVWNGHWMLVSLIDSLSLSIPLWMLWFHSCSITITNIHMRWVFKNLSSDRNLWVAWGFPRHYQFHSTITLLYKWNSWVWYKTSVSRDHQTLL